MTYKLKHQLKCLSRKKKENGPFRVCLSNIERNNSYYFSRANQQKAGTKIYSLSQCSLTVNECDWHILAGNDEKINSHCLTREVSTLR